MERVPETGSVAHTVAHLYLWASEVPEGLARIFFYSEIARRSAVKELRDCLEAEGFAFQELVLPTHLPADETTAFLLESLHRIPEGTVVSISDFTQAYRGSTRAELADALRTLNSNREPLTDRNLCQIWWISSQHEIREAFPLAIPDLNRWFLVRLNLTDITNSSIQENHYSISNPEFIIYTTHEDKSKITATQLIKIIHTIISLNNDYKYNEAIKIHQSSILLIEKSQIFTKAIYLNAVGYTYKYLEQYDEALKCYQEALEIREKVLGEENVDTAESEINLGSVYQSMGQFEKALELYHRALMTREKILGSHHADTARVMSSIASTYQDMGKIEEALNLYQYSLSMFESILGPDHRDTAKNLNNLATVYQSMGRYEEAMQLYQRSLSIREKILDKNSPDLATALNNLAGLYKTLGETEEAQELYQRAREIFVTALGEDHPLTKQAQTLWEKIQPL